MINLSDQNVDQPSLELARKLPHIFYTVVVSERCTLRTISRQCLDWLEYNEEELICENCCPAEKLIHPDDRQFVLSTRQQGLGNESLMTMEYRLLTKTGNILHVIDRWISYRSPEDNCWIIEGQLSKATEGQLKRKLIHQLRAYRDAVDVNLISSITDSSGKIIYVNENFCRISRYSATELIGQNHRIVCSGHHPKSFFAAMWKTISDGRLWHGEIMNKAKDGSLYWVDTVIIPIFDEQKRIEKYLSLRMLITDRKRAEEQRTRYSASLEKIAFMVAHDTRGPLCSIQGLVHILINHPVTPQDARLALGYLKDASIQLEEIIKRLSQFVFKNETELKATLVADRIAENHDYIKKLE